MIRSRKPHWTQANSPPLPATPVEQPGTGDSVTIRLDDVANAPTGSRADHATNEQALALLRSLNISDFAQARPQTLSVGQAARASLARALVTQPKLLLADEPTAALDAVSSRLVVEQIARYVQAGGAAIVASHDPAIHTLWSAASGDTSVLEDIELPR